MDYYNILGLTKNATADEIKQAYKKLAMKHHPDRNGGDESKFKELSSAYEILSNPEKRQMYDLGHDPASRFNQDSGFNANNPFGFNFNSSVFDDLFGFTRQRAPRNKTYTLTIAVTLEDVFAGKEYNTEVAIPGQPSKIITIVIPAGIENGQSIKYAGMGDTSFSDLPPGDLIVTVQVNRHARFDRAGADLIYHHTITVWEAMLGSTLQINMLNNKTINVTIPPGTQPDTTLQCKNEGLPHPRSASRGNLRIKLKITIPTELSDSQKQLLQEIQKQSK